jgi:hydrogenase maturation protease
MSGGRVLVAGIGNIFLGDDAFGVEVARRLLARSLPADVRVVDFGIRGIDLTYALLDDYEQVILVDAVQRGGKPGTLYTIEPAILDSGNLQTHEMAPAKVLAAAKAMGAKMGNIFIIGCEAEAFGTEDEPQMGMSPAVEMAVIKAVEMIEGIIAKRQAANA